MIVSLRAVRPIAPRPILSLYGASHKGTGSCSSDLSTATGPAELPRVRDDEAKQYPGAIQSLENHVPGHEPYHQAVVLEGRHPEYHQRPVHGPATCDEASWADHQSPELGRRGIRRLLQHRHHSSSTTQDVSSHTSEQLENVSWPLSRNEPNLAARVQFAPSPNTTVEETSTVARLSLEDVSGFRGVKSVTSVTNNKAQQSLPLLPLPTTVTGESAHFSKSWDARHQTWVPISCSLCQV